MGSLDFTRGPFFAHYLKGETIKQRFLQQYFIDEKPPTTPKCIRIHSEIPVFNFRAGLLLYISLIVIPELLTLTSGRHRRSPGLIKEGL